jgi:hypothetical protein
MKKITIKVRKENYKKVRAVVDRYSKGCIEVSIHEDHDVIGVFYSPFKEKKFLRELVMANV